MGRVIDSIFDWGVESLRTEIAQIADYETAKLRVSQLRDKFQESIEVINKQLGVNYEWHKGK